MQIINKVIRKLKGNTYPYTNLKSTLDKFSLKNKYAQVKFTNEPIDVVLLTLNRFHDTKSTLQSLYKTSVEFNLIVIDQNSDDGTREFLQKFTKSKSNIKLIMLDKNIGVSGGRAMAIEYCKTNYVAFIDNDMYFVKGYFENLLATLQNSDAIATLGKIILPNEQIELNKPTIEFKDKWVIFHDLDKNKKYNDPSTFNQAYCDWIPGVALWKREVFNKVKIDKDLIGAFEDNEFSLRLKNMNYKFINCPKALVIHIRAEFTKSLKDTTYTAGRHNKDKILFAIKRFYKTHNLYFASGDIPGFVENIGFKSTDEYLDFIKAD